MPSPGIRAAAHTVWTTGLVRPRPSYLASRCSDHGLISTESGSVAAHHDARHQLSREFTPATCPRSPDGSVFLGSGLAFRSGAGCRAFNHQPSPQPPAENPGQSATPNGEFVHIIQAAVGYSFPSGHVMAYIAYWGLLFSFGFILFEGRHWWRIALLGTSAAFIVLIGPSRVYLGDHWASDVLGAYLIGGFLLGLSVGFYLPLKERGVLETPEARARMKEKNALRSFPTKGWF